MNGEELAKILCLLAPGMSLTVPDEWMDRTIAGSRRERADIIRQTAFQFGCACREEIGSQTFEKLEYPATG